MLAGWHYVALLKRILRIVTYFRRKLSVQLYYVDNQTSLYRSEIMNSHNIMRQGVVTDSGPD